VNTMTKTATGVRKRRGPRGEYAKSSATREAILDAALEVFASGYNAGSLRDIATRVGMSEAGLLHHFKSKSVLLSAVLELKDDRSRALVDMAAQDAAETLRGLVALARHNASVPGVVELYCTLSAESTAPAHPAHEYFQRRYDWVRESLERTFARLIAEGRLAPGISARRAAIATIAMMDGLQVQWLLDRDVVDMADALQEFLDGLVIGGI